MQNTSNRRLYTQKLFSSSIFTWPTDRGPRQNKVRRVGGVVRSLIEKFIIKICSVGPSAFFSAIKKHLLLLLHPWFCCFLSVLLCKLLCTTINNKHIMQIQTPGLDRPTDHWLVYTPCRSFIVTAPHLFLPITLQWRSSLRINCLFWSGKL